MLDNFINTQQLKKPKMALTNGHAPPAAVPAGPPKPPKFWECGLSEPTNLLEAKTYYQEKTKEIKLKYEWFIRVGSQTPKERDEYRQKQQELLTKQHDLLKSWVTKEREDRERKIQEEREREK